jgi:hypothetical protein
MQLRHSIPAAAAFCLLGGCGSPDNAAPEVSALALTGLEGEVVSGWLPARDPEHKQLKFEIVVPAESGTATIDSNGWVTYRAAGDWYGHDRFQVKVSDAGGKFVFAMVNITVLSSNVAPVARADRVRVHGVHDRDRRAGQ